MMTRPTRTVGCAFGHGYDQCWEFGHEREYFALVPSWDGFILRSATIHEKSCRVPWRLHGNDFARGPRKGGVETCNAYLLMQYKWVAVRRKISPSAKAGVLSV